jgi:hypothetical protein
MTNEARLNARLGILEESMRVLATVLKETGIKEIHHPERPMATVITESSPFTLEQKAALTGAIFNMAADYEATADELLKHYPLTNE